MTAPYTAADSSSVALAEEELAAISARAETWTGAPERELFSVADVLRLVAELTRARETLQEYRRAFHASHNPWSKSLEAADAEACAALGDAFAEATASKEEGDGDTER